jgi:phosphoribosylaminoimidazole carboxylase (NCAIR synthetase)
MKKYIAIHERPGSFSDRWIEYCAANNIPFKTVNCHQSDIIQQLNDSWALMWHFHQSHIEDMLIAHAVIHAAEVMGIKVFPNTPASWHFDDKVSQKYLMEALGIPCVPSYVFVIQKDALQWASLVDYPKVFKLRNGAGSSNVRLDRNANEAKRLIKRAFATGFPPVPRLHALQERWW